MDKTIVRSVQAYNDGYCSQGRTTFQFPHTITEGIKTAEDIIQRGILCYHDVKNLGRVYQTIDSLERNVEECPNPSSSDMLEKINKKVADILAFDITPENLITLYHLQGFLQITKDFKEAFAKYGKSSKDMEKIASRLPCCLSEDRFKEDWEALIGKVLDSKTAKILERKRERLKDHTQIKENISQKKGDLEKLREANSKKYPAYLDGLLEHGYFHLYDHLIKMGEFQNRDQRRSVIEQMPFSKISHIVLEVREAVIQSVESSIFSNQRAVLFLLGCSGSGKSTTLAFLRGDRLVLNGFFYESQNNRSQIIGDDGTTSCTFLPTVEVVDDLVIVDFPGFDDTHGQIVSLGMEFALKYLIKKYSPKILVLESITNVEGRFAAAGALSERLGRLLENKKDCILGITKYSKDPDFGRIRELEEQQRKELSTPTQEEISLAAKIEALSSLNMPQLESSIKEIRAELDKKQKERAQQKQKDLPETTEKAKNKENLKKTEEDLLEQIGLQEFIRFYNLEDKAYLSSCLERLRRLPKEKTIRVQDKQKLDAKDEKWLKDRFLNNLKIDLEKEGKGAPYASLEFESVELFEQNVWATSLINTIVSQTEPEIGQFLHLPEMCSKVAHTYDKEIVENCIQKYMKFVVNSLNVSLIEEMLKQARENHVSKKEIEAFEKRLKEVQGEIISLARLKLSEDPDQAKVEWERFWKKYADSKKNMEEKFKLGPWLTALLAIPVGIPYGVLKIFEWHELNEIEGKGKKAIKEAIEERTKELEQILKVVKQLKAMEDIIRKKEEVDEIFKEMQISLESPDSLLSSIQRRIERVRQVYGEEKWDVRVESLSHEFALTDFDSANPAHISCVQAQAYWLIEPDLNCSSQQITKEEMRAEASKEYEKKQACRLSFPLSTLTLLRENFEWQKNALSAVLNIRVLDPKKRDMLAFNRALLEQLMRRAQRIILEDLIERENIEIIEIADMIPTLLRDDIEKLKEENIVEKLRMVRKKEGDVVEDYVRFSIRELIAFKAQLLSWKGPIFRFTVSKALKSDKTTKEQAVALVKTLCVDDGNIISDHSTQLRENFYTKLEGNGTFDILHRGKLPKLLKEVDYRHISLLRAMYAAAFLKAHEKWLKRL